MSLYISLTVRQQFGKSYGSVGVMVGFEREQFAGNLQGDKAVIVADRWRSFVWHVTRHLEQDGMMAALCFLRLSVVRVAEVL